MSCLQLLGAYSDADDEDQKNEAVDETLKCLQNREIEQTQVLHDFIDDFVASQEYADYMREKRNISKCSTATQCDSSEIVVECRRQEVLVKYPLTAAQKKMVAFERHFEKYAAKIQRDAKVKKQERSIQIIKGKIAEARKIFECTRKKTQTEKGKLERDLMRKYSAKFGIDLDSLSAPMQLELLAKFRKCHQDSTEQARKRQENWIHILEKLVQEYKLKKPPHQPSKPQPRLVERVFDDLMIVGTKIQQPQAHPVAAEVEPSVVLEAEEVVSSKKGQAKKQKAPKQKPKTPKVKKPKTKSKKQKPASKLVLPTIPLVNPREKLLPANIPDLVDLIEEFGVLDCAMENRDLNRSHQHAEVEDSGLSWEPSLVQFENFSQNQLYRRTVTVRNVSGHIRKIRFLRLDFPDAFDQVAFSVESSGTQKLYTGCEARFSVLFEPFDGVKAYSGKLVLLSLDTQLCEYSKLEIPIQCVPKHCQVSIERKSVHFGRIPIWKADDRGSFQLVKALFSNQGLKACTVCLRKAVDPLQLRSIPDEGLRESPASDPLGEVAAVLSECLDAIGHNFRFESSFFRLGAKEEKRLKVHFTHAPYIGDYFEEYTASVYEAAPAGGLELADCQMA
uniref:Uncharacterized protein n=1 Tax=Dendroctonus ponderosae TaxID=77166 RepID=A0AAR5Q3W0_DENPD